MSGIEDLLIHAEVTCDTVNRKKDRSVSIKFTTLYEITNEDFAMMDKFHQESGHLLFRRNEFTPEDVPKEDVDVEVGKSQSTQLRDALWVLFKAEGGSTVDKEAWNRYYRQKMQAFKARVLDAVHTLEDR